MPQPRVDDPPDGPLHDTRPLLAVVPAPAGDETLDGRQVPPQHRVQLFSLRTQGYVKTLAFSSEVQAVLCSSRVMVVALRGLLQVFDAVTLESTLTCLTYSPPPSRPLPPQQQAQLEQQHRGQLAAQEGQQEGAVAPLSGAPCALGQRWLAYAADQVSTLLVPFDSWDNALERGLLAGLGPAFALLPKFGYKHHLHAMRDPSCAAKACQPVGLCADGWPA